MGVGADGPLALHDHYLVEKLAQFNRERVPERVVHAKGSGAFGFFEVTQDVSQYTKADLFNGVGKTTPMKSPLLDRGRRARLARHAA
jgi:catalase